MSTNLQRAEAVFQAVLETRVVEERASTLNELCRGDAALRREVESLLASHDAAGDFLLRPVTDFIDDDDDQPTTAGTATHWLGDQPQLDTPPVTSAWAPGSAGKSSANEFVAVTSPRFELPPLGPPRDRPDALGRLGEYDVLEFIGCGGMGIVLKAWDARLDRVVAIKVMKPFLAGDDAARQRFLQEARAAAKVNHPNVVTIHAVHELDNLSYLVMEYVSGETLAKRIAAGPLSPTEIVHIGHQAALGLAAAHKRGIVHRDVKPANILLVNDDSQVKITDFGLARVAVGAALTHSGLIVGTPQYMSPEQALGEPVDARSDLFSLGSVLYAMCTGIAAFDGETIVGIMRKVSDRPHAPVNSLNPQIPGWLVEIIDRLLAKRPEDRIQTAAELATLLDKGSTPAPGASVASAVQLSPEVAPSAVQRLRRRVLTIGLLASLIIGAATFLILTSKPVATVVFRSAPIATTIESPVADSAATPLVKSAVTPVPVRDSSANQASSGDWALQLDRKSCVTIPSLTVEEIAPHTMEAYVKFLGTPDGLNKHVFGWIGPTSVFLDDKGACWTFGITRQAGFQVVAASNPATVGRRHHLAAVRTGQAMRLFIDGRLMAAAPEHPAPMIPVRGPFCISTNWADREFIGIVDELRVSTTARYETDFTPQVRFEPDAQTKALYHCDEGQGDVLSDSSGNNHHGTIVAAHWVRPDETSGRVLPRGREDWPEWPRDLPPLAVVPFDAAQASRLQKAWARHLGRSVEESNSLGMRFQLIPPGEFQMGAAADDLNAQPGERPQHWVRLTRPYLLGASEVSVSDFRKFVEATGYVTQAESDGQGAFAGLERRPDGIWKQAGGNDSLPVRCVSWEDARQFCEWLSRQDGGVYRLPTDAEWEFACRAGTTTWYSWGNLFDATRAMTAGGPFQRPGTYPANAFGLFDMHGNAHEICGDSGRAFTTDAMIDPVGDFDPESLSVVRGGSVGSPPARLRSSQRYLTDSRKFPEKDFATVLKGFRVLREVPLPAPANNP